MDIDIRGMAIKTYKIAHISPLIAANLNALVVGSLAVLNGLLQIIDGTYSYLSGGKIETPYLRFLGAAALEGVVTMAVGVIVGWIFGLVVSLAYNWWVRFTGGIKIDLDDLV